MPREPVGADGRQRGTFGPDYVQDSAGPPHGEGTWYPRNGDAPLAIHSPLLRLTKAEIVKRGVALGVDYGLTLTCYDPSPAGLACGHCDACQLRRKGFVEAGVKDPTRYQTG